MMALRLSLKFENDSCTTAVVLGDMPKFPSMLFRDGNDTYKLINLSEFVRCV